MRYTHNNQESVNSMNKTIWSYISDLYYKIEKRYKVCFYSAIICGLFAHIFALTNHLYNYDELWHTPTGFGTGTEVGRWALSATVWIQKVLFKDAFTIPFVNGFITILLYTITACIVVSIFDIKDEFYAAVTGALMITFPSLVCRMFFMFTTHYYAIGIVMVAAGIWILVSKKHSVLNVIILLALVVYGMAIYQANFVTGVCLVVGHLLQRFIKEDVELKDVFIKCVTYVIYLGVCMISFLVSSKVALAITGKQMETYENLDTMGQLSIPQLIEGIVKCYKTFLKIPFKDVYGMNPNGMVRLTFLVCMVVLLYTLIKVWISKRPMHMKVFVTLIMCVLPVGVNLIAIMAIASGTMYSIMVYEIVYIFLIPIACLEALRDEDATKEFTAINILTALCLICTVVSYIWFANGNYLAMDYTNERDFTYYTVLMAQVKSVDGYKDDMAVATVGKPTYDDSFVRETVVDCVFNLAGKAETNINAYSSWNIMTRVLGFDPVMRDSDEDEAYFRSLPEVQSMPNYPDSGSIKIIDDTIVIKFQNIDELSRGE